jgi:hypothetical protein
VIATLLQFHHNIHKAHSGRLVALGQGGVVLGEDVLVVLLLKAGHVHPQNLLDFGGQVLLDVLLDAAENEGLEDLVELGVASLLCAARPVLVVELIPGREL